MRVYHGISEARKGSVGQVTAKVRAQVLRLHGEGIGVCEIAREVGIDRKQVARVLESVGIKQEASTPASSRLAEILELRGRGVSISEIGRRLGFSRKAVAKALAVD